MVRVQILEQPAKKIRYRYKSERRQKSDEDDDEANRTTTAGIPGINSVPPDNKTFPSIVIEGYEGWATIRVSCVVDTNENGKYRPHPHELAGPNCKEGFYQEWLKVTGENFVKVFDKLSIRCTRKRDVLESLELRRKHKVDPFKTGKLPARKLNMNLGAVRLCFEVFIHNADCLQALEPQVSEIIFDEKKLNKLKIFYCSHTSAPVTGSGGQIVLLCDQIFTKDINVVFFETDNTGKVEWETIARSEFIFRHVAVAVKVPSYRNPQSLSDHKVRISLWDVSEETKSTMSYPFTYTGVQPDPAFKPREEPEFVTYSTRYGPILARKRAKNMHWIPPELYNIPTSSYNFQGTASAVPSTSIASEISNLPERRSPITVDRFFSVPEKNHENRHFSRESSCPDHYMTGNSPTSTSLQSFDALVDNYLNIDQADEAKSFSEAGFINPTIHFGTNQEDEAIRPTTTRFETSDVKYEPTENMEVFNFTIPSNIQEQVHGPPISLLQSILPTTSTHLPNSSNGLPSMNQLISHLRNVHNNEESMPEDPYSEFINSPNYPNFNDLIP